MRVSALACLLFDPWLISMYGGLRLLREATYIPFEIIALTAAVFAVDRLRTREKDRQFLDWQVWLSISLSGLSLGLLLITREARIIVFSMAGLILLLLIISQFIAIFNYSNMATLAAVSMADFLEKLNLPTVALLIGFVIAVFGIDLIITAAIAKWAIFAPVFVPLLMQLGVAPEVVLAAYRVGDSPMNSITPLNAYFAMIVTFAIKYQKDAGVGTVIALMLPYVIAISVVWTALLAAWYMLGLPWGL
jgi:hypothetical protein